MKVVDTHGNTHSWSLVGHKIKANETKPRSSLHLTARNLIREEFPTDSVLEEVGLAGEQLFFDFYIPRRKLAIEVHGEQHYKFIKYFHGDLLGFQTAQRNDERKATWCQLNNIILIILPFNESQDEWQTRIKSY